MANTITHDTARVMNATETTSSGTEVSANTTTPLMRWQIDNATPAQSVLARQMSAQKPRNAEQMAVRRRHLCPVAMFFSSCLAHLATTGNHG